MKNLLNLAAAITIGTIAFVVEPASIHAQLIEWPRNEGGNGHFYGLTPSGCWTEAQQFAVMQGGHLVTIDDSTEYVFLLFRFVRTNWTEDFWIGLHSPSGNYWSDPSTWKWVTGSTFPFYHWRPGQPDYGFGTDRYAVMNYLGNGGGRFDNYPNCEFRQVRGIYEVEASPPSISCPSNLSVIAANGECNANVNFAATATGTPPIAITYSQQPGSAFPVGTTTVTCTASNSAGSATCSFDVTVIDDQLPTISVSLTPSVLWPPNHKLVEVTANVAATDNCPGVSYVLQAIASNEPDNGLGDGDKPNDIQSAVFGAPDLSFLLRAERSGRGNGRRYSVTYSATDASGNVSDATAIVTVPHALGKLGVTEVPDHYALEQNFPNPFNPTTTITYALPLDTHVSLAIYNLLGQKIRQLVDEEMSAGYHDVVFDASELGSGVYIYRFTAGDFGDAKKLIVVK